MGMNLNLDRPLAIAGIILGSIVGLLILAAFMSPFFGAVTSITENFTTADTGNDAANAIVAVFAFIVPIVLVLGLVALVVYAARLKTGK